MYATAGYPWSSVLHSLKNSQHSSFSTARLHFPNMLQISCASIQWEKQFTLASSTVTGLNNEVLSKGKALGMFYTRLSHSSAAATHVFLPVGQPEFPLGWKLSSPELLFPAQWAVLPTPRRIIDLVRLERASAAHPAPNWNKLPQRSQTLALCHVRPQNPIF